MSRALEAHHWQGRFEVGKTTDVVLRSGYQLGAVAVSSVDEFTVTLRSGNDEWDVLLSEIALAWFPQEQQ